MIRRPWADAGWLWGGREGRGAAPVMVAGREKTARAAAPLRPIAPSCDRIDAAPTPLTGPHLGETARRGASCEPCAALQPCDQNVWRAGRPLAAAHAALAPCGASLSKGWPRPALHHLWHRATDPVSSQRLRHPPGPCPPSAPPNSTLCFSARSLLRCRGSPHRSHALSTGPEGCSLQGRERQP